MKKWFLFTFLFIFSTIVIGNSQVNNDFCNFAFDLGTIDDYCSGTTEFNNTEATFSGETLPFCWFGGSENDMWFTFTPQAPGIYIQMTGFGLDNPSIVVYEGDCNNLIELACESKEDNQIAELTLTDLIIGQEYILRVDARNQNVGAYQLCLRSYVPVPSPESDCVDAVVLCNKESFLIENLDQVGDDPDELEGPCVGPGQDGEKASVWYTWTCDQPGSLTFTLTPNNPNNDEEDLDFVVYELPGGLSDCDNKIAIRCMLSGESGNLPPAQNEPCYGETGLAVGETDVSEEAGCNDGSNNFLAPLDMEAGKSYALIVNNFSQSGYGFGIDFGGTGTFLGPQADFDIEYTDTLECDKLVEFINQSFSNTDNIVDYHWSFGQGAEPLIADGPGPHNVFYESYGQKVAGLTIETERGCTVTKILEFFVEECCDVNDLVIDAEITDILCADDNDGSILINADQGNPFYLYSLDDENYKKNPLFSDLGVGMYTVYVTDIKGCKDSLDVDIQNESVLDVDAGPDITVNLGYSADVFADVISSNGVDSIFWSPTEIFETCLNCLDPTILAPGTTTYTITVTDIFGCISIDQMTIFVNVERPIYVPNIFSPNNDGNNEYFNVFGNLAVDEVEKLLVYDRWGNLVYEGSPQHSEADEGWNGDFNGEPVNSGVFAWMAQVRFIDDAVITYSGTVTVVR